MAVRNGIPSKELKPLSDIFDRFTRRVDRSRLLSDFFALAAMEIAAAVEPGNAERKKEFADLRGSYTVQEQDLMAQAFAALVTLFEEQGLNDWLGELYMLSGTSSSNGGQFFTPFNVSILCSKMAAQEGIRRIENGENVITVSEPACGSGGMVLAFAQCLRDAGVNYQQNMLADCSDLDQRCVHMAYVQLTLAGIPAVIRRQNTLTMEQFGPVWHTPALVFDWLRLRRYVQWTV